MPCMERLLCLCLSGSLGGTLSKTTPLLLQPENGTPGKGSESPPALKEGLDNDSSQLDYMSELAHSHERRENLPTLDYESWAECWIGVCRYYCRQLTKGSEAPSTEKSNAEHPRTLMAACVQCAKIEPIAAVRTYRHQLGR